VTVTTTGKVEQGQIPRMSFKKMEEEDDDAPLGIEFYAPCNNAELNVVYRYASRNNEDE
jgi:hypothetical protein